MDSLTAVHLAIVLLLGLGGVAKIARPGPASTALRGVRLAMPRSMIRALGAGEAGVAAAALSIGGPVVWGLVAVAYVSFAIVGVALWRSASVTSCGCFGDTESEPGPLHVAVTGFAALIALRAAVGEFGGIMAVVIGGGSQGAAAVGAGLGLLAVVVVLLTSFPPLVRAVLEANG